MLLGVATLSSAGIVTWDGGGADGLWMTDLNWSGTPDNTAPIDGDTVNIGPGGSATVSTAGLVSGVLPNGCTINLTGSSTLTPGIDPVIRLNSATIEVESGSTLADGFWDLSNAAITFENGAAATMGNWEQKGTNSFTFELGASGFTALTPNTFLIATDGTTIADASYTVDMLDYTGGTGIITLMDFAVDVTAMDDATFQGAGGLNILNPGLYQASLHWSDANDTLELHVVLPVNWDGSEGDGLWVTALNWDGGDVPGVGDVINIVDGGTVSTEGIGVLSPGDNLPSGATITLTGASTLTTGSDAVIRLNGATIRVDGGSTLAGNFWDLNNGSLSFGDGSSATMSDWEQKGSNSFFFELGASGFTALTPGTFRIGGGATIADASYTVDMANYTGGVAVIPLVDFSVDAASMDDSIFQGAGALNVINAGDYVADIRWNDTTEAIELHITSASGGLPEIVSIEVDGSGDVILTLDGPAVGLVVQQSDELTDFDDVPSTVSGNTLTVDSADTDPNDDGADFYRVRD